MTGVENFLEYSTRFLANYACHPVSDVQAQPCPGPRLEPPVRKSLAVRESQSLSYVNAADVVFCVDA